MRTPFRLAPLAFLFVLAAGCDTAADVLGIDTVDVPLGSAGASLAVSATPSARAATVSRGGGSLPDVFLVQSIKIAPADVSFTPTSASKGQGPNGTVIVRLFLGGYPAGRAVLNIADNAVTGVNPPTITIGQVDSAELQAFINRLPAAQRPTLAAYSGKSARQIAEAISAVVRSNSFEAVVAVEGTQGLTGTVTITRLTLGLDF